VRNGVTVGMPDEMNSIGDFNSAQEHSTARSEAMRVVSYSRSEFSVFVGAGAGFVSHRLNPRIA
jgi:hypothetical protein